MYHVQYPVADLRSGVIVFVLSVCVGGVRVELILVFSSDLHPARPVVVSILMPHIVERATLRSLRGKDAHCC